MRFLAKEKTEVIVSGVRTQILLGHPQSLVRSAGSLCEVAGISP